MRHSSRVIIRKDDELLLIHRHKKGVEFYVPPGGGLEEGETPEIAAIREAKEETGLDVVLGELFFKIDATSKKNDGTLYVFLVDSFSGELKLGGPEVLRNCEENRYEHSWVKIKDLDSLPIKPVELKIELIKKYRLEK